MGFESVYEIKIEGHTIRYVVREEKFHLNGDDIKAFAEATGRSIMGAEHLAYYAVLIDCIRSDHNLKDRTVYALQAVIKSLAEVIR